jgi:hypothetical protein
MRLLTFLEYAAIVIGAVGMAAANYFSIPKGFHLGLFLVGAGIALGGLESIFTGRMSFRFSRTAAESYSGAPALTWGLVALVVGCAVIAAAYLMEQGLWRVTVNYFMRRPGPLLVAAGLVVTGVGALLIFNPLRRRFWWTLLVRVPKTAAGLVLLFAGFIAIGIGLWEWFHPQAFDRLSRGILAQFGLPPFDHYWKNLLGRLR